MKTIKYDPVDFMDDSEDMLAYLCEITETGDPEMIAGAIYDILRAQKKLTGNCCIDEEKLIQSLEIYSPATLKKDSVIA